MADPRIIVIEDEPAVARAVVRSLRRSGYHVDSAACHADALGFFEPYDCGIFDISLPDSDGVELAVRLRDRGLVQHVVFFSAVNDAGVEMRARREGVFVHKSEGIARLRGALTALFAETRRGV